MKLLELSVLILGINFLSSEVGALGYGYGHEQRHESVFVNKTVLCRLRGGSCVTNTAQCSGNGATLKFTCDNLSTGLCCFNSTNNSGYGSGFSSGSGSSNSYHTTNYTRLCQLTGGTCVTDTTRCSQPATLRWVCNSLSNGFCCSNTSTNTQASYGQVRIQINRNGQINQNLNQNRNTGGNLHSISGHGIYGTLQVNQTTLCRLRGHTCVTNTNQCAGRLGHICDNAANGFCCNNNTNANGYGYHNTQTLNATLICQLQGGVCTNLLNACTGHFISNCDGGNICCKNSTTQPTHQTFYHRIPVYQTHQPTYQKPSYQKPSYQKPHTYSFSTGYSRGYHSSYGPHGHTFSSYHRPLY